MFTRKPKFNFGETIFFLDYGKIKEATVTGVIMLKNDFRYWVDETKDEVKEYGWKKEKELFNSREELINSL